MLKNYWTTTLRNLKRNKIASGLNIVGLAVGMACCILIFQWVRFEVEWNGFHENLETIYLLPATSHYGEETSTNWGTPPAVGPAMKEEFPEVVASTRITPRNVILRYGDRIISQGGGCRLVDPDYLTMFTFPLLRGDPAKALSEKHSIVLTESIAENLFGDEDPMGETVLLNYEYGLKVTGIAEDPPANSTLRFDSLIPIEWTTVLSGKPHFNDTWTNLSFTTFVQLRPDTDIDALGEKIFNRIRQGNPESNVDLHVFPFADVNLYSVDGEGGFLDTVIMISVIALLVLGIACINFMNMATARAGSRAKEVGVRKVSGARRSDLIGQFYFESMVQSFLALALALVIVEQLLPMFRELTSYPIRIDYMGDTVLWGGMIGITLLTGVVSGSYPALFLSSFRPVNVFRGALATGARGAWFRRILVVIQFGTATALIICTVIVYRQFDHMQKRDIGFDRTNLVYFGLDEDLTENYEVLKQKLLQSPEILSVTRATGSPTGIYWNGWGWNWEGKDPSVDPLVTYLIVDDDWPETFGIEMAEGRFYKKGGPAEGSREVVINETWAKIMGYDSAVGRWIEGDDPGEEQRTIIGVVKDFHFKPLHAPVGPILIYHNKEYPRRWLAFVRISGNDVPATLSFLEETYREVNPDRLYEPGFLEDIYGLMYTGIRFRGEILRDFAVVAVLISCLGLFGLSSYLTEQRSKEIGIRKVLGSSVLGIVLLLVKEFLKWVIVANVIAWPVAFWLMRRWLEDYIVRVDMGPGVFLAATGLSLAVALFTVSFRAVQAGLMNPIDAIRFE